ncbi:MAG TPA: hypothetical protein VJT74_16290 [Pyrinomonadaceae bacterium]|nr:hypothetical protein [Pyrinomonadaceae bacterium]
MKKIYLGDSYDIVKRFWAKSLRPVAPLDAHPRFVPEDIRTKYTAVTSIPVLDTDRLPERPFGLFLDPNTGIPLPSESKTKATAAHAPLRFIVQLNEELRPTYIICFDQSYHRSHELTKAGQLEQKREVLRGHGLYSFYYVSHAPFLFAAEEPKILTEVRRRLVSRGIPRRRLRACLVKPKISPGPC